MKKIVVVFAAIMMIVILGNKNAVEEIVIPNEAIRIRVIANSNSNGDQNLKQQVRYSIQKQLGEMLQNVENIEEVRQILNENLSEVEYSVEKVLEKYSGNHNFQVDYGYNYFPQKTYKGIEYDSGYYESVVITLGEAKGENWWCVLFPPLCLMEEEEENIEDVEYISFIKEMIDQYF